MAAVAEAQARSKGQAPGAWKWAIRKRGRGSLGVRECGPVALPRASPNSEFCRSGRSCCEENIFPSVGFLKTYRDNAGEALDGAAGGLLHLCLVLETSSSFGAARIHSGANDYSRTYILCVAYCS